MVAPQGFGSKLGSAIQNVCILCHKAGFFFFAENSTRTHLEGTNKGERLQQFSGGVDFNVSMSPLVPSNNTNIQEMP